MSNIDPHQAIRSTELFKVLYKRDIANKGFEADEAAAMADDIIYEIKTARMAVLGGENPEEILEDTFGLEPDYIFDLMP